MSYFCSWCGYPAEPIDVVLTGMMRGHGLVWLCTRGKTWPAGSRRV